MQCTTRVHMVSPVRTHTCSPHFSVARAIPHLVYLWSYSILIACYLGILFLARLFYRYCRYCNTYITYMLVQQVFSICMSCTQVQAIYRYGQTCHITWYCGIVVFDNNSIIFVQKSQSIQYRYPGTWSTRLPTTVLQ